MSALTSDFTLDPRLASDARLIGDLPLCRALLMDDARFPWIILVPRRAGLVELTDLSLSEQARLTEELAQAVAIVRALPEVEKVNIGALGNIVRQFHAHVVGRNAKDPAWPGPVWGVGAAKPYDDAACEARLDGLRAKFLLG